MFTATVKNIRQHEIVCDFTAMANGKLLAGGSQGQKILKRARLTKLYQPENGQE
jgi:hypothetical protein